MRLLPTLFTSIWFALRALSRGFCANDCKSLRTQKIFIQHIRSGNFLNYISAVSSFCITFISYVFYVVKEFAEMFRQKRDMSWLEESRVQSRKLRNCITINSSTMQVAGTRKTKWFLSNCYAYLLKQPKNPLFSYDESGKGSRRIWWCLSDSCILRLYRYPCVCIPCRRREPRKEKKMYTHDDDMWEKEDGEWNSLN